MTQTASMKAAGTLQYLRKPTMKLAGVQRAYLLTAGD